LEAAARVIAKQDGADASPAGRRKIFAPIPVRTINSILQDKMLFGSDWPVITPDRWLSDFAKLEIREEIRPKVLKANARRLLGI
jgi:predicted TIM-barrel fold metal-dependent hydrolase